MTYFVYIPETGELQWYWASHTPLEAPEGYALIDAPDGADGSWIGAYHVVDGQLKARLAL